MIIKTIHKDDCKDNFTISLFDTTSGVKYTLIRSVDDITLSINNGNEFIIQYEGKEALQFFHQLANLDYNARDFIGDYMVRANSNVDKSY